MQIEPVGTYKKTGRKPNVGEDIRCPRIAQRDPPLRYPPLVIYSLGFSYFRKETVILYVFVPFAFVDSLTVQSLNVSADRNTRTGTITTAIGSAPDTVIA